MKKTRKLSCAFALGFGLMTGAGVSFAQQVADQQVESIEITGSHIKRSDVETVENIQRITVQEIKSSGQETVADYLRTLSSTFGNSTNESFSNSFAPGAAMIGLRGLSQVDTLVLLNGRRITSFGFFQNLSDAFVDLNVIPVSAIDHIDILKSGASAIYGSDAIAGVVNIVLKQNTTEKSVEAGGRLTTEGGAATRDANLNMGFGDFASQGYNVFLTGSVFKRDQLLFSQRSNTQNQDYRNLPAGMFRWASGNDYRFTTANGFTTPPTRAAFSTCGTALPGQVVNESNFPTSATGTVCGYNTASYLPLMPGTDRANLTGTGNLKLGSDFTAFADIFYSYEKTKAAYTPTPLTSGAWVYNPANGGVTPITNTLLVGDPSNPYPHPVGIDYTFFNLGGRDYSVISNTWRVTGGVKGSLFGWDVEGSYGHSQNHASDSQQGGVNGPLLASDIAAGPADPFNFLNPSLTPAAGAALGVVFGNDSIAKLDTVDLKGSGAIFDLPGGKANAAIGAEFRHESVDDEPGAALGGGLVLSNGVTKVVAARSISAGFAELDLPILKSLEADLAAREEHYSDVGSSFTPQATLRFQPAHEVTFRAVVSRGFRAPSLAESSNSTSLAHQVAHDPLDPAGRLSQDVGLITGGNPNIKPETSKNIDLGMVLSPTKNVNFSLDYYKILMDHVIAPSGTAQSILADPVGNAALIHRAPDGTVSYVVSLYTNQFRIITSGYDVTGDVTFPLSGGAKVKLTADATYVSSFQVFDGANWNEFAGNNGWDYNSPISGGGPVPHWRGTLAANWENPDWLTSATVHYTDSYKMTQTGGPDAGSFTTLDLFAQYRGFKNWKISGTIVNVMNIEPPYDADALTYFPTHMPYDPTMYDNFGRMIDLHVSYSF